MYSEMTVGSCEHSNETSNSINGDNLLTSRVTMSLKMTLLHGAEKNDNLQDDNADDDDDTTGLSLAIIFTLESTVS
jgi:hypothetical protein